MSPQSGSHSGDEGNVRTWSDICADSKYQFTTDRATKARSVSTRFDTFNASKKMIYVDMVLLLFTLFIFILFFALKREEAHKLLQDLPDFEPSDNAEDNCGICLLSFEDIIEDNKKAMNEELSRHAGPSSEVLETPFTGTGIVKLPDCGHIFCRKEYVHSFSYEYMRKRY